MQEFGKRAGFIFIVSLLISLVFHSVYARDMPAPRDGTLDLRQWDFETDGPVRLSGQWRFYWSRFISHDALEAGAGKAGYSLIQVPGTWNGQVIDGKSISGTGYATYHLTLLLDRRFSRLALKLLDTATASRLVINGRETDVQGVPAGNPDQGTASYHPKVVEFDNDTGRVEILFHVSNYHHRLGGMWEPVLLGTPGQIHEIRERKLILTFFVLGNIFIIGIYHFFLFYFRQKDTSNLFFGIFCLLVAIRFLFTNERYIVELMPAISYAVMLKVIYLSFYLCIPSFALYMYGIFKDKFSSQVLYLILGISTLCSLFTLVMPSLVFSYLMPGFQALTIIALGYGVRVIFRTMDENLSDAYIFTAGLLILFFTVVNDILLSRQLIDSWFLAPVGILSFIVSQSILISHKFSKAFFQIEASEKKYRDLIEQSSDGICILQEGRIVFANSAFLALAGEEGARVIGQPFDKFIHPDEREMVVRRYQDRMDGKSVPGRYQVKGVGATGKVVDIELDTAQIDWQGKKSVLSFVRNITAYKKTQELLIQSEKMLSVGGLAAGMAHEINNPLAGMIQNANLIKSRLTNIDAPVNQKAAAELGIRMEDIRAFMEKRGIFKMIDAINAAGKQAAGIVDNMLSFARKGESLFSFHDPVRLMDSALDLAMADYDLKMQFSHIEIKREYDQGLPKVFCDGAKIRQVLLNLFRNGAYAMGDKAEKDYRPIFILRLAKEDDAGMVRLEIQDNGTGMDPKTQKRIFEPFFTTKPEGEGSGLGLSTSYFIVTKNHNGTMDVVSTPGDGATFIIRLPVEKNSLPE